MRRLKKTKTNSHHKGVEMKPKLVEINFPNDWNAEKIVFLMVNHSSEED